MSLIKEGCPASRFHEYAAGLKENADFKDAAAHIDEMDQIMTAVGHIAPKALEHIQIDFSLARGLEYYTGMVFEAKLSKSQSSVSGGGRYDHLLETINPTAHMPLVGGSIGIERIFALLELDTQQERELDVMICSAPGGALSAKLELYGMLLSGDLRVGISLREGGSLKTLKRDLEEANQTHARFAVIVGEEESKGENVTIKDLKSEEQTQVAKKDLVRHVQVLLGRTDARFVKQFVVA